MITPHLADTGNTVEMAELLLAGIPNGVEKAARSAISRTAQHTRTVATREVTKNYAITAKNVRAESLVTTRYRYMPGAGIEATVRFSGKKIPLYRYEGTSPTEPTNLEHFVPVFIGDSWKMVHPGKSAKAHQLRSTAPTTIGNTFIAEMKSGHKGIFERSGSERFPIQEKMGSSVPQMIGRREVLDAINQEADKTFHERFAHEVEALVFGYRR